MDQVVLGAVVESVTGHLLSLLSQEFGQAWGVKAELVKLQATVSIVGGVLREADKRRVEAEDVKEWLKNLKELFDDADDLLDDFSTEVFKRRRVTGGGQGILDKVCTFFSSSNQLLHARKMANRVKEIRERIDAIWNDRGACFQLEGNNNLMGSLVENRARPETIPFKSDPYVIGRDKDKEKIIEFLLNPDFEENVSVLPIVGVGGLGKTTLARLVFNDDKVKEYFEMKLIWVCVSINFNVEDILRKIVRGCTPNKEGIANLDMNELLEKLKKWIDGKKFLLVLDDVWKDNRSKWLELREFLMSGAKGSKILVTTRYPRVAETMTREFHELSGLPEDEALSLLMLMAMKKEREWKNQNLEKIAREIVKKCARVPLAIKTFVEGDNYVTIDSSHEERFQKGARHVTTNDPNVLNGFERDRRIRSLFLMDKESIDIDVLDVSCFRSLRALRIRGAGIKEISPSIGKLKHLRSLDLSENHELRYLPDSIRELCNLESLNLTKCRGLKGLPSGITELVNLRHLMIEGCGMSHMPRGIGKMTSLQRLNVFVVGGEWNQNAAKLNELSRLSGLRKELTIKGMGNSSISSEVDASFSMEKLADLQCLELRWGPRWGTYSDEEVSEKLRPHSNLKGLRITTYYGARLPSWISQLHGLVQIEIIATSCRQLPPVDQLPFLKRISLFNLGNLEHIELSEGGTMPQSNFFPSLEEIKLRNLPEFKGWEWERRGNRIEEEDGDSSSSSSSLLMLPCFSDKVKVKIDLCPRFSYMSHGQQLLQLGGWRMRNVTALHQLDPLLLPFGPQRPTAMTDPSPSTIIKNKTLAALSDSVSLTALTSLSIIGIEDVEHLPTGLFQSLPSLQSLEIWRCPRLKALPLGAIQSLPSLQSLEIRNCPPFGTELQLPQLPSFKRISLWNLGNLEHIELWEVSGTMPQSNFFPSLEVITLRDLPKFKGWEWERRGNRIEEEDGDSSSSSSSSSSSLLMLPCFSDKVNVNIDLCPGFSYMHGQQLLELRGWRMRDVTALLLHQHDPLLLPFGPQRPMAVLVPTDPSPSTDSVSLTALTSLSIIGIEDVEHLPTGLFQSLPSLQSLRIGNCPCLKALPLGAIQSLPSLQSLKIWRCPRLKALPLGAVQSLPSLQSLQIEDCPRLKELPLGAILRYISTLETLRISYCPELDLSTENDDDDDDGGNAEGMTDLLQLQGHHKLRHLSIWGVHKAECLPGWFQYLSNLQSLTIGCCEGLKSLLPVRLILPLLTTLDSLVLSSCPELDLSIGESEDMPMAAYSQFTKLRELEFYEIEKLETLPWWIQHLTNLESLDIRSCKNLKALPEWFPNLTSLKRLQITFCGDELTRRCQGENGGGEDWPKISHIPAVVVF
ncbi:hypothetical protein CDL15_Pgr010064 [Punica granatum]|uniref:Disease resistance protein RGA4 n=1 Tax=Punica granatum TaxID=22663 RepID=A0A218X5W3_PUNGR|nr:hypothetical protein CDL15_Pgr010064 [Punica granatum]